MLTALGGIPGHAVARLVRGRPSAVATAFRIDTMGLLRTPDRASEVLLMARDDQAQLFGDGWSAVDSDEVSPYRWMTRTEARLLLPIAKPDAAADPDAGASRGGRRAKSGRAPRQRHRAALTGSCALAGTHTSGPFLAGMAEPLANEVVVTVDRLSPQRASSRTRHCGDGASGHPRPLMHVTAGPRGTARRRGGAGPRCCGAQRS